MYIGGARLRDRKKRSPEGGRPGLFLEWPIGVHGVSGNGDKIITALGGRNLRSLCELTNASLTVGGTRSAPDGPIPTALPST